MTRAALLLLILQASCSQESYEAEPWGVTEVYGFALSGAQVAPGQVDYIAAEVCAAVDFDCDILSGRLRISFEEEPIQQPLYGLVGGEARKSGDFYSLRVWLGHECLAKTALAHEILHVVMGEKYGDMVANHQDFEWAARLHQATQPAISWLCSP